ncbi:uncharacterized protein LOC117594931 [Esox lucius]|uniref:uncharacterized protein LOC117594931 n=1 Tax=Esox lucius TaxID=8010 RepID=UPI001476C19D|nr:uncharacterized protein LOC117594931 [Esox lucius]
MKKQAAEIIALTEACILYAGKEVSIYTDSQYAHSTLHVYAAQWARRGMTTSTGRPVEHAELLIKLLVTIQLPRALAVVKCKAHTKGTDDVSKENALADAAAKLAALTHPIMISMVGQHTTGEHWMVGQQIGRGDSGVVTEPIQDRIQEPEYDETHVIKIEPKEAGTLFTSVSALTLNTQINPLIPIEVLKDMQQHASIVEKERWERDGAREERWRDIHCRGQTLTAKKPVRSGCKIEPWSLPCLNRRDGTNNKGCVPRISRTKLLFKNIL